MNYYDVVDHEDDDDDDEMDDDGDEVEWTRKCITKMIPEMIERMTKWKMTKWVMMMM